MGTAPVVARAALHYWEEPVISGSAGSGTVFFSGCNLGCKFCQNRKISAQRYGKQISVRRLAEIFKELELQGAHNINLVTPTHFIPAIIEAFKIYRPRIPVVYNCGGYESEQAIRAVAPYVDVWLPDFKYSDNALAAELSGVGDYAETAKKAVKLMAQLAGEPVIDNGLIKKGVIVRHLVLPGHTKNSIGVLGILDQLFPGRNVLLSLMSQFTPEHSVAGHPELDRRITRREYAQVFDALSALDFDGFAQEVSSAKEEYIPPFDNQGV
ncbi:MAG: radical SAM protein [Clostridia bacterium]|nr:radical SAM protein [Clostridia bacterium]